MYKHVIIIITSIVLVNYIWDENAKSYWWVIDDHQLVAATGDDGEFTFSELIERLEKSPEVGKLGTSGKRVRPSYFINQSFELFLFGADNEMFYLVRKSINIFYFIAMGFIVLSYINIIPTLFLILCTGTMFFWSDIFGRLGPAEIYTTLGASLYFLGFFSSLRQPNKQYLNLILIMSGAFIAIGSKENFTILAGFSLFLLVYKNLNKTIKFTDYIANIFTIFCSSFIAFFVYKLLKESSEDVYSNDTSSFPSLLIGAISDIVFTYWFFAILTILIFVLYQLNNVNKQTFGKLIKDLINPILALIALMVVWAFQIGFYSGKYPTQMRYDFPGLLIFPLMFVPLFLILDLILKHYNLKFPKVNQYIHLLLIVPFFYIFEQNDIDALKKVFDDNYKRTEAFHQNIKAVKKVAIKNPDRPLIFVSGHPFDYEPMRSWLKFLRVNGVTNQVVMKPIYDRENFKNDKLLYRLSKKDLEINQSGFMLEDKFEFTAESKMENQNYLLIAFSVDLQKQDNLIGRVW